MGTTKRRRHIMCLALGLVCLMYFASSCVTSEQIRALYSVDPDETGSPSDAQSSTTSSTGLTTETNITCQAVQEAAEAKPDVAFYDVKDLSRHYKLQGWEDEWLSNAKIQEHTKLTPYKLDVVYTFVDSDDNFLKLKEPFEDMEHMSMATRRLYAMLQARRYRSWEELRYSIRSIMYHGTSWLANVLIVAKDYDLPSETNATMQHIQQFPEWLNRTMVNDTSVIQVIPESSIMPVKDCLPTFNSVSVEAALGNLPKTTEFFLSLSDDMMFGRNVSVSDFVSPLFGMAISHYEGMWALNEDAPPNLSDGESGESHPAKFTSYLLNARFGKRPRTLQIHQAKVINKQIMNEAMSTFPHASTLTPLSRFRDDSYQLYPWYLHMWYTVDMHREAILWSIVMRTDTNGDGVLSLEERNVLVEQLHAGIASNRSISPVLENMNDHLESAGLTKLLISVPKWTSLDGPIYLEDLGMEECNASFSVDQCFSSDFLSRDTFAMEEMFDQITDPVKSVRCGDCLIKILLNNAPTGLSPILPKKGSVYRKQALKAIQKYQYYRSAPDNGFYMIRHLEDAKNLMNIASVPPGLLCVNDDITVTDTLTLSTIGVLFRHFLNAVAPWWMAFENSSPAEPLAAANEAVNPL